jgi:hypothetical protein
MRERRTAPPTTPSCCSSTNSPTTSKEGNSTETESYFALYHAVQLALEEAARSGDARRVPLIARIWSINRSFVQTGRSALLPGGNDTPPADPPTPTIGAFRIVQEPEYPGLRPPSPEEAHRANVKTFEAVHRFFKWYWAWRRRLRQMLGLRR